MSFFRHGRIYQSDGPKVGGAYCSAYLATIVPMSLQPAIPSWVALQQSPCPLHRSFIASLSTLLLYSHQQRTVNCLHFPCLNTGVHSTVSRDLSGQRVPRNVASGRNWSAGWARRVGRKLNCIRGEFLPPTQNPRFERQTHPVLRR
jgi:hypothetical protein